MTRLTALILLALAGCNDQAFNAERAFDEAPAADGRLRIDVYAPTDLELTDDRGELLDLRPQTFFTMVEGEDSRVTLTVTPAVAVGGLVEGIALTPFPSADVPTVAGPLAGASVQFGQEDGVQQPRTVTFADGVYDVPIVPSELEYAVAVIPATPYVPIHRERVAVDGRTRSLDFFVDLGVPVWGEVTDTRGNPIAGISVHVETSDGLASVQTETDDAGRYLIAVNPDEEYTVVATPANPRDPVLRNSTGLVAETGSRVDLVRGSDQVGTISGSLLSPDGGMVSDDEVRVRIVSTELDGYGEGTRGSIVRETSTFRGNFDAVVPSGTYRIELAPQELDGPSPLALDDVVVTSGQTDIGSITLPALPPRFGDVVDMSGSPVASAIVTCTEIGFAARSWTSTADPTGQFILTVPTTAVSCAVTPPADRIDLALTRQAIDREFAMNVEDRWLLSVSPGSLVSGFVNVRSDASLDAPTAGALGGAVIEIRDAASNLLGIAISDRDGAFSIRVAQ